MTASQQVGDGVPNNDPTVTHAFLWQGLASATAVDTDGIHQVGRGYIASLGQYHGILWTGTAASAIDLTPAGSTDSNVAAVNGNQQVGQVNGHAGLWRGTAASFLDLHTPSLFSSSAALNTNGSQQVGHGFVILNPNLGTFHAALWNGTAASAVDLNPAGFKFSRALGTNGLAQVGWGRPEVLTGSSHALMWTGSASSGMDLHALLPAAFANGESIASSVDAAGNIFGIASDNSGRYHAVQWSPFPGLRPGDTDRDGDVDFNDLIVLAQNYGKTVDQTWSTGDFNADTAVNFADLVSLAQNYSAAGITSGSGEALPESLAADWALAQSLAPEPAVFAFMATSGIALMRRRNV
jgi:hypothetical protein